MFGYFGEQTDKFKKISTVQKTKKKTPPGMSTKF